MQLVDFYNKDDINAEFQTKSYTGIRPGGGAYIFFLSDGGLVPAGTLKIPGNHRYVTDPEGGGGGQ